MRAYLSYLVLGAILFILTGCPAESNNSGQLPDSPQKFTVRLEDGGGMLPIYYSVYICKDSAYWKYSRYRYETIIRWIPTKEEVSDLYEILKENDFHKIESDCEDEVYDRGGTTIYIDVDDSDYKLDNSGNCFIKERWVDSYRAVARSIGKYYHSKINEQLIAVPLIASEKILNSGYDIHVRVNDNNESLHFTADSSEYLISMYPGYNEFTVQVLDKDSTDKYGNPFQVKWEQLFEEVSTSTKQVVIDWTEENVDLYVKD